jgi:hypothetical protein
MYGKTQLVLDEYKNWFDALEEDMTIKTKF